MSFCVVCNIELNISNAYYRGKKENRLTSHCKKCFNKYCSNRWKERKRKIVEEKGSICADCKCQYHYSVYEFHHLDPSQKEFSWSKAKTLTEEKMKKELDKCIMLCANCHRLRHWGNQI